MTDPRTEVVDRRREIEDLRREIAKEEAKRSAERVEQSTDRKLNDLDNERDRLRAQLARLRGEEPPEPVAAKKVAGYIVPQGTVAVDTDVLTVEPDIDEAKVDAAVEDNTRSDLMERAAELDIEGRSSMSKRELAEAIAAAEALANPTDPSTPQGGPSDQEQ